MNSMPADSRVETIFSRFPDLLGGTPSTSSYLIMVLIEIPDASDNASIDQPRAFLAARSCGPVAIISLVAYIVTHELYSFDNERMAARDQAP